MKIIREKRKKMKKSYKEIGGITLVALVVTIVVLLILAGITLVYVLGDNSVFNKASDAKEQTAMAKAREKLEMVLSEVQIDKHTNAAYNENGFLDEYILNKITDTIIIGDMVFVDHYVFELDRNVPKIGEYIGIAEYNENIKISATYQANAGYEDGKITNIKVTYDGTISEITLQEEKLTIPEKTGNDYILADKEITANGIYHIIARDENNKLNIKSVKVTDLTEDMEIWNKADMIEFARKVNEEGRTFKNRKVTVMADIDLEGSKTNQWIPIGNMKKPFKGTFEGNNKTIKNIYIDTSSSIQGFFGVTSVESSINDFNVDNGYVKTTTAWVRTMRAAKPMEMFQIVQLRVKCWEIMMWAELLDM